jgi:signal transduction histidine kinase
LRETRSLTIEISPPSLQEFGFVAAAESLVKRFNDEYGIGFKFSASADKLTLSDTVSIMLYRSLRELMVNVIKHSSAKRCEVDVSEKDGRVIIVVSDDGQGFDLRHTLPNMGVTKGFGLFSIKEHLESYGGSMNITSAPDVGTEVILRVPLSAEKNGGKNG